MTNSRKKIPSGLLLCATCISSSLRAQSVPDRRNLSEALQQSIPGWYRVSRLDIEATSNAGTAAVPIIQSRFAALLSLRETTYNVLDDAPKGSRDGEVSVVSVVGLPGTMAHAYGVMVSERDGPAWRTRVNVEKYAGLAGDPRRRIRGRVLIQGTPAAARELARLRKRGESALAAKLPQYESAARGMIGAGFYAEVRPDVLTLQWIPATDTFPDGHREGVITVGAGHGAFAVEHARLTLSSIVMTDSGGNATITVSPQHLLLSGGTDMQVFVQTPLRISVQITDSAVFGHALVRGGGNERRLSLRYTRDAADSIVRNYRAGGARSLSSLLVRHDTVPLIGTVRIRSDNQQPFGVPTASISYARMTVRPKYVVLTFDLFAGADDGAYAIPNDTDAADSVEVLDTTGSRLGCSENFRFARRGVAPLPGTPFTYIVLNGDEHAILNISCPVPSSQTGSIVVRSPGRRDAQDSAADSWIVPPWSWTIPFQTGGDERGATSPKP